MKRRHKQATTNRQTGVTLVELILSMVIISIALVGILSVMNITVAHSADPMVRQQAIAIAESYMEEVGLQAYDNGGTAGNRADFDEVADYDGLNDNPVKDQRGNAIPGLSQYSASISVSNQLTLTGGVHAKQITVNVSGPGVPRLSLVGYKMEY